MYYLPYWLFMKLHERAIDARRKDRSWKYAMYSALAGLCAGLMLAIGVAFATLFFVVGLWWLGAIMIAFVVIPPLGALLVRHVAVPLGWYRVAYYLGAHFARATGKDAPAYGLACGAWACIRRPRATTGSAEAWLGAKRDARTPLGDAEVVVTAFITAGRGDLATARQLVRSTPMLVESHPAVRELCGEWLAVDAAARGAWAELFRASVADTFPPTPLAWLLEGIAARKVGAAGAPTDRELVARWLLAPYRRMTRALVDEVRADAAARPTPPPAAEPTDAPATELVLPPERPPLPRAITASVHLTGATATRAVFDHAVEAWDTALADEATRRWLATRARELDAPLGAADRAIREIAAAVVDQLVAVADVASLGAAASRGLVGDALARRLRHGRLDSLEAGFDRWVARRSEGAIRLPIDEWREFVALHAAYSAAVAAGGTDLRRLAFQHAWTAGNRMAAWLWNTRNEYVVSHAISRWLYDEALAVGDTEAIELGHRNCTLEIPTRLGRITITPR